MQKDFTLEEVQANNGKDGKPLFLLDGVDVYNLTEFSPSQNSNKQEAFSALLKGKSDDVKKYLVGKLKVVEVNCDKDQCCVTWKWSALAVAGVALAAGLGYVIKNKFFNKKN